MLFVWISIINLTLLITLSLGCTLEPEDCEFTDGWVLLQDCDVYPPDESCFYISKEGLKVDGCCLSRDDAWSIGEKVYERFLARTSETVSKRHSWNKSTFKQPLTNWSTSGTLNVSPGGHNGVYQLQGRCGNSVVQTHSYLNRPINDSFPTLEPPKSEDNATEIACKTKNDDIDDTAIENATPSFTERQNLLLITVIFIAVTAWKEIFSF